ncbi:MAG: NAD(P)-dependent oxidoreductase [Chloroflexi bacterium]|nr:NAD(P)-dependent oxidoreductase [Chloroflexota bacterium]
MAEAKQSMNILVTGGAEGVGLATVRALLQRGHKVAATACDAEGALAVRMAGALPVFPDLGRASEIASALAMTKAEAIVHAGPQYYGGSPQAADRFSAYSNELVNVTAAVAEAAKQQGVKRIVSLSFGYLYESSRGAAKEGDHDVREGDYAPMLQSESLMRASGLSGTIVRSGYIYGGASADTAALADAIKGSRRLPAGAAPASWIHEDDLAAAIATLLEAESTPEGVEIINAAAESTATPGEFCAALSGALGLSEPRFAAGGFLSSLREKNLRDRLLEREVIIDSRLLRERFAWRPRHESLESGMEATALVWRMKDAVHADDYYNAYEDEAAAAIESFAYDVALPEPAAEAETPVALETAPAPEAAPAKAEAPPPSDGPTPWNEDEAKREERRRKALERKAKRAARSAGG